MINYLKSFMDLQRLHLKTKKFVTVMNLIYVLIKKQMLLKIKIKKAYLYQKRMLLIFQIVLEQPKRILVFIIRILMEIKN